jgi:type VI secretion system protein ImpA
MMDTEALLQPISDEAPCGDALDYDVGFLQLEIAARGRSEQQIGDSISAGEEPDWRTVESLALELGARSKDLRVAVLLARARLHNGGFPGLDESLRLLAGYVGRYWEHVHPVLEPDDDDTIRVNALAALADPGGLLGEVRRAPLASARNLGSVSLRDLDIAHRRVTPGPDTPEIAQVDIETIFTAAPVAERSSAAEALVGCVSSLNAMKQAMLARGSFDYDTAFDALSAVLRDARTEVDSRVATPATPGASPAPAEVATEDLAPVPPAAAAAGEIRARSDIVLTLERVCRWYAANEPASPVPVLLERAKRLVSQDFLSLLVELAPAGVEQFRNLAGIRDDAAPDRQ